MEGAPGDRDELAALVRSVERLARRTQALGRRAGWRAAAASGGAAPAGAGRPAAAPSAAGERNQSASPYSAKTSDASSGRPASPAPRPAAARPEPVRSPVGAAPAPAAAAAPNPAPAAPAVDGGSAAAGTRAVAQAARTLEELAAAVANCRACELCATRTQTVFADGSPTAKLMFVGEGPGAEEDRTGVPFVGDAGQLLSKIIADGMKLDRARDVYIANVVKCRPPGNRDPSPEEKAACTPFLERQIELVDPQVIVPLGRHAAGHLLRSEASMSRLRGQVVRENGRAIVPTFHPAYLLRTPAKKKECWEDIQLAMRELGLPPPR